MNMKPSLNWKKIKEGNLKMNCKLRKKKNKNYSKLINKQKINIVKVMRKERKLNYN